MQSWSPPLLSGFTFSQLSAATPPSKPHTTLVPSCHTHTSSVAISLPPSQHSVSASLAAVHTCRARVLAAAFSTLNSVALAPAAVQSPVAVAKSLLVVVAATHTNGSRDVSRPKSTGQGDRQSSP